MNAMFVFVSVPADHNLYTETVQEFLNFEALEDISHTLKIVHDQTDLDSTKV